MALFVAICTDKPNSLDLRMANRPAHLEFLGSQTAAVKAGGPFVDGAGAMIGSMLIVECPDRAAAEALIAQDPYGKAGLFASVDLREWRWTISPPQ